MGAFKSKHEDTTEDRKCILLEEETKASKVNDVKKNTAISQKRYLNS